MQPLTAQHPLYSAVYQRLKRQRLWPMSGAATLMLSTPPPPPPPPPPPTAAAAACEPDRIVWNKRTRQSNKPAMAPITQHGLVQCVPCDPQKANVVVARPSGGLRLFVATCVYGAALHGWGAEALACLQSIPAQQDPDGHLRARTLLHGMLHAGIPVLLCLGARTHPAVTTHYEYMFRLLDAGSPMLVCDDHNNLLMMAQPMGRLVYAPEGKEGLVPQELRDMEGANAAGSRSCLELWARPLCVTEYDAFAWRRWFKAPGFAFAADFNWAVDDMHQKDHNYLQLAGQPVTKILPNTQPINALFKKTQLASLGWYLGDYAMKLRTCTGVLKKKAQKKRPGRWSESKRKEMEAERLNDDADLFHPRRRAVLLRAVLDLADVHGHAHRLLGTVLPASLLTPGREAVTPMPAIPEPPSFLPEQLKEQRKSEVETIMPNLKELARTLQGGRA